MPWLDEVGSWKRVGWVVGFWCHFVFCVEQR